MSSRPGDACRDKKGAWSTSAAYVAVLEWKRCEEAFDNRMEGGDAATIHSMTA
jgi:hypothetical protein